MVGSIEVFIGVEKKVTIVKKVTDRNLKGYRLFIYRLSAVTKEKTSMKFAVDIIVIPSLQKNYIIKRSHLHPPSFDFQVFLVRISRLQKNLYPKTRLEGQLTRE